jgi:Rrf2 family protein
MKLSTKGRYAARIMVYLARRHGDSPARKQEIADAEGISADYVEQILVKLKTAGLVNSRRGAAGGFRLARDPESISIADVVGAAEGPLALVPCQSDQCERSDRCVTRKVWEEASALLQRLLAQKTLAELAKKADEVQASNSLMYHI